MYKLTFEVDGRSIDLVFNELSEELKMLQHNTAINIGERIVEAARATTKFNHGAHFNQGIKFKLIDWADGEVTSEVFNSKGTEYSQYMQFGNLPVEGKKMTFQIDGDWITTYNRKAIGEEHLGFMTDAAETGQSQAEEAFTEEFDRMFSHRK